MPVLAVKPFGGLRPMISPVFLENNEAQIADNCRLISGSIVSLKGTTTLKTATSSSPATIFRYGTDSTETNYWLEFTNDTDVIRSPIANDAYARLYWADGTQIKYAPNSLILSGGSYPGGFYNLGVPAPASAPTISSYTSATEAAYTESRLYVMTYVSAYGEEGPPSVASSQVTLDNRNSVSLTGLATGPSGAYNIATKRIYRSSVSSAGTNYQFVAEIPLANSTYTDSKQQAALGETLPSLEWYPPPADLKGLKMMSYTSAIAFKANTIYLSESGMPHAWPYQYTIDYQIVGIGVFGQTAVVLTNGYPYQLNGADPSAMSPVKMELPQACVSKRSIVDTGDGVMYASPDGLVSISSAGIDIVTKNLLSRDQWQAYNPSSMNAAVHDNRYYVTYTTVAGARGMLIFDFSGQGAVMTTSSVNTTTPITAMHMDPRTDTLYMAQGGNIVRFNQGTSLSHTWKSKIFTADHPMNFSFAQVYAMQYPATIQVYAGKTLKFTKTVNNALSFRLPGGFREYEWEIAVTGTGEVRAVYLATSMEELNSVP